MTDLRHCDGHSTAYQRSLRSQWRNLLATVTLTYSFTLKCNRQAETAHTQLLTVVTYVVELQSNGSRTAVEPNTYSRTIESGLRKKFTNQYIKRVNWCMVDKMSCWMAWNVSFLRVIFPR